jgi:hypothetical protein
VKKIKTPKAHREIFCYLNQASPARSPLGEIRAEEKQSEQKQTIKSLEGNETKPTET